MSNLIRFMKFRVAKSVGERPNEVTHYWEIDLLIAIAVGSLTLGAISLYHYL